MSTSNKRQKQHDSNTSQTISINHCYDLVTNHNFIAPFEICGISLGLFSVLLNRHIIDVSYSKLYQQSIKVGWDKIFLQERQKLKPNDISLLKCFVLNRLLYEYSKNSYLFIQQAKTLYDDIQSRMVREFPQWTSRDLFHEVRRWRDMQCRRRLFYFSHQEGVPLSGLLMLQKASTNRFYCLINHWQKNKSFWETEGHRHFTEHFQYAFIIVAQPTGSGSAAVTQYTKNSSGHSARLNCRIICLLDPDILKDYIELSNIDVTLYPLDRETNHKKEKQPAIQWEIRKVVSADGVVVSLYCAEFHTLQLEKFDSVCKRLSLNSTLCQLEFQLKIKVENPEFEQTILLATQPFGICSHAQYFPKFVAQIFLYEMKQILNDDNQVTDPSIIAEFIRRYYIRMMGIEPTDHTNRYFREVFVRAIEDVKSTWMMNTLDNVYEEILAKIVSQIDFMVLHPVLSLMYEDSLFLGICNSNEIDGMLNGTEEQPHLLLRFNTLTNHQWNANPTVQFIIHDGNLKRASFDMKTFANEMCRFICESSGEKTKRGLILSTILPRSFSDFQWYFHEELYRLNKMTPPSTDSYDPLLPVLWMTMRQNDDHDALQTPVTSKSTIRRRKRSRSNSLSMIDSVSSESPPTIANIVEHFDNISAGSSQHDHCSMCFNSTVPLSVLDKTCPADNHKATTKNRQIIVEIPANLQISPAIVFRYLGEKLTQTPDDPNEMSLPNYLFRPNQTIISLTDMINIDGLRQMTSPRDGSTSSYSSSAEISNVEAFVLTSGIHDDIPSQSKIKEEPQEVDDVILNDKARCE